MKQLHIKHEMLNQLVLLLAHVVNVGPAYKQGRFNVCVCSLFHMKPENYMRSKNVDSTLSYLFCPSIKAAFAYIYIYMYVKISHDDAEWENKYTIIY